jgi:hypothetical protein
MRRPTRASAVIASGVLGAIALGLVVTGAIPGTGSHAPGAAVAVPAAAVPLSTAAVQRRDLSSQVNVNGSLGYAGSYPVSNLTQGIVTAVPGVGEIIKQGRALYKVDGEPVVLLDGSTAMYRMLAEGVSAGPDVRQLNADLVSLGYASSSELDPSSDEFSAQTARAIDKLQGGLGLDETGQLGPGQVVFLPCPIRVTAVAAADGMPARRGGRILTASSTHRVVDIALDAALQAEVAVGNRVVITLPSGKTTPGTVTDVGNVATSTGQGSAAGSAGPVSTVTVQVTPSRPAGTGTLDQAPVQVAITTATARNALVVPVNALMALAGGGYALEVAGTGGKNRLVAVTPGLFDDAAGLVAVTGPGLSAGMRVVVPAV